MLWTHFEASPDGLRAQAHMPGPRPDDLVVVSGQDVIDAIANARLGIDEAYRLGLIRLYGTERQMARFRAILVAPEVEHRALDNQTLRMGEREQRLEIMQ